jgi:ubiquinone/menaquinone biosynthesis C-methylase UbiE
MSSVSYRHFTGTAAENYQRDFVPAIATPVSRDLLRAADLRPGERVLDVACGTGAISRLAAERVGLGGSVTAIDIAPDMIDVAKAVAGPDGAKIDWRTADAESLPLPDASVDVVLCQMGLMFMENRSAAIAEMRRVLADGRVVVNTPGRIQPVYEHLERAIVEHISPDLAAS